MAVKLKPELQELCAQWWADRLEIEGKRRAFKEALAPKLEAGMILSVDYDPDNILLEALDEAGVECRNVLPSKTIMKIRRNSDDIITVRVKIGYGDKFRQMETGLR